MSFHVRSYLTYLLTRGKWGCAEQKCRQRSPRDTYDVIVPIPGAVGPTGICRHTGTWYRMDWRGIGVGGPRPTTACRNWSQVACSLLDDAVDYNCVFLELSRLDYVRTVLQEQRLWIPSFASVDDPTYRSYSTALLVG
jgi:hypothetical protein